MNCARLFLKPLVSLLALVLITNAAVSVRLDPKNNLEKANKQILEMLDALGKQDYSAAKENGEAARELVHAAMNEMWEKHDGEFKGAYQNAENAHSSLNYAIRETKDQNATGAINKANEALQSIDRAIGLL